MKKDVLVLDGAPQPLDERIVQCAAAAIHADADATLFQWPKKELAGELRALIGVEDLGLRIVNQSGIENLAAQPRIGRIGGGPTENETAEPIDDGSEVGETVLHPNIRNIAAPDVVYRVDGDAAEQVGIDLVARPRPAEVAAGMNRRQAQDTHQALDAFAIDTEGHIAFQHRYHAPAAVIGAARVVLVEQSQQQQVLLALEQGRVVVAGSRQAGQLALARHAQVGVVGFDPLAALANRGIQIFF